MQKVITLPGGKLTFTVTGAQSSVEIEEDASLGGGEAQGVLSVEGDGKATLNEVQAVQLAEAILNAHLSGPFKTIAGDVESFINSKLAALGQTPASS